MTKEQIEKLDLTRLSGLVEEQLGMNPEFGNVKVTEQRSGGLYLEFVNTKEVDAGVFGKMCKRFQVVGFGNENEEGIWVRIHFDYDHKGGGSNGIQIGNGHYDSLKDEWIYQSV